ncbi:MULTISPECIES: hypothetical protein [unclassified Sinorhizobium]|uniref:hypothetical protein n=1 Tax=unclassified Sinorhizobium TaxID=2613772 RepID=UPI003523CC70
MNPILSIAAVIFVLSVVSSFAQEPTQAPPPPPDSTTTAPEPTTPERQAAPSDEGRPRYDWRRERMRGHPPLPPPSKAARFRIEDGDVKIDIKCADDEPTKVCADLLLQTLDRLEGSSPSRNGDYQ